MTAPVEVPCKTVRLRPHYLRGSVLDLLEDQVDSVGTAVYELWWFSHLR